MEQKYAEEWVGPTHLTEPQKAIIDFWDDYIDRI